MPSGRPGTAPMTSIEMRPSSTWWSSGTAPVRVPAFGERATVRPLCLAVLGNRSGSFVGEVSEEVSSEPGAEGIEVGAVGSLCVVGAACVTLGGGRLLGRVWLRSRWRVRDEALADPVAAGRWLGGDDPPVGAGEGEPDGVVGITGEGPAAFVDELVVPVADEGEVGH